MFLSNLSIKRPILVLMAVSVFLIFGYLSFRDLNLNQTPAVEIPFITIMTVYPGASPKEIETQVSKKIEDAVASVSQIKTLQSFSLDGFSVVMAEFDMDKDVDVANQEVKDKIDPILNKLPNDAEMPIVQKVNLQEFPTMDLVLSGSQSPRELYEFADKSLSDKLSQIAGVGQVSITGGQEREIRVVFDDRTVYENMISIPQLMQILSAQNVNLPGGYFQLQDQDITVRVQGKFKDIDELRNQEIPTQFGNKKLGHIARVEDSGKDIRQRAVYYDKIKNERSENIVRLSLIKSTEGNPVDISESVYKLLPEIREVLTTGMTIQVINDSATMVRATVDDTLMNVILGVIFTSIVLLFFLHDLRTTLIVAISMPASILATFLFVDLSGFSLNVLSLSGISVSVGVLVANSVVVIENIYRYKEMGYDRKQAAAKGTSEVVTAVVAATLTNIVVFVPLGSIDSIVGQFLQELAFTAAYATIFSLVFSFTITPMLASIILPDKIKPNKISKPLIKIEKFFENSYRKILDVVINRGRSSIIWSWGILVGSFVLLILVAAIYGPRLGIDFMPTVDNGKIRVEAQLPEGYELEQTAIVMKEIEDSLKVDPDVERIITNLGKVSDIETGANLAVLEVYLNDASERDTGVLNKVSEYTEKLGAVANAKIKVGVLESMGGGGGQSAVDFYILGPDLDVLDRYKDTLMMNAKNVTGLINFDNSARTGKPEIRIEPIREKLAETGLTVQEMALSIRAAVEGIEVTEYEESGEEYDIKITFDDNVINSPEKIGKIPLATPRGVFRVAQLAKVSFSDGFSRILHYSKMPAIQFTGANALGVPTGNVIADMQTVLDDIDLPTGYRFEWSGTSEMQQEMVADLLFAFLIAFILTYMLLAAILESFWQPLLILVSVPLAFIGVILLSYYTDTNFGLTANMGIIMLLGIVVNNSILILDYTNHLRNTEGILPREALMKAAPVKLKPIIMSTVAIILGMLPMAIGMGDAGYEIRQPLGVVSIGGLVASTFLTLLVIPAGYFALTKMGMWVYGREAYRKKKKKIKLD